ncbi:MAG: hypothetical protein RLY86_1333, partial [Pseudomonadota bacterium]
MDSIRLYRGAAALAEMAPAWDGL